MINPEIGLRHESIAVVDKSLIVPSLPQVFPAMADMPPVFATAYLVAFVEAACIEALHPILEDGEATVGTHIELSHCAPTPVGREVRAEVELIAFSGRRARFRFRCSEVGEAIGEGLHERVVIERQRFIERCYAKLAPIAA